jgi:hypothetical protein
VFARPAPVDAGHQLTPNSWLGSGMSAVGDECCVVAVKTVRASCAARVGGGHRDQRGRSSGMASAWWATSLSSPIPARRSLVRPESEPSSVDARRRDPAGLGVRIPIPRDGHRGSTPEWPGCLIEPTPGEYRRWVELWGAPQAAVWAERCQERAVASLVRLEQRDTYRLPARLRAQLCQLRGELGLSAESTAMASSTCSDTST